MAINYVSEFIFAGQKLESSIPDRRALDRAYVALADDVAKDIVNQALQPCLEDMMIVDSDGYSYVLDEGEIERLLTNAISAALMQMAGR